MTKFEKIITSIPPISSIIRISKNVSFFGYSEVKFYDVMISFFRQVRKVGLNERAASISFNLVMALPAALLFLFSIIPYLPDSDKFESQILSLFKDISPNSNTYLLIKNILKDLLVKHVGVFSFGFVLLIFYSSNAMMGIIRTFDKSIMENRVFFLHKRWRAIVLTSMLILLVIASTTLLIGQNQFATILKGLFHMKKRAKLEWWNAVRWIILVCFLFYGIGVIYKFGPSVKKRWPLITPGSILATTLTLITTILFSYWVNHFASYNKVYGSIGTVLILLLLINLNSLILLIGFELNVSLFSLIKNKNIALNENKFNNQQA